MAGDDPRRAYPAGATADDEEVDFEYAVRREALNDCGCNPLRRETLFGI
ncbi:hypothetical protein [Allomesorhizobium camelthorni]|nr:hypothetical protein [Mesorhizobium camelthorni]